MEYTIVEMPERTILGPVIRTGNNDPECSTKIGGLWQRFMEGGMAEAVPDPVLRPYSCFGLYHNYDFGDMSYDMMVGCESRSAEAPEGMGALTIPAGSYAKFAVQGDVVASVIQAWEDIWSMEELMAMRANTVDFEAYLPSEDPKNTAIELYIALQ